LCVDLTYVQQVTNGQFYEVYQKDKKGAFKLPASWIEKDGEMHVCRISVFEFLLVY